MKQNDILVKYNFQYLKKYLFLHYLLKVTEENEEKPIADHNKQLFKTAFCMLMNVTQPKDFLNFLPLDTEVNIHSYYLQYTLI